MIKFIDEVWFCIYSLLLLVLVLVLVLVLTNLKHVLILAQILILA
ncbi:hypothetical protein [Psychrobacter immobilis]|nr:hypothetical protein [Psychrobacter immobilis]